MKIWVLLLLFAILLIGLAISQVVFAGEPGYKVKKSKVIYTYRKHFEDPFLKSIKVAGADPQSFEILSKAYARDHKSVYFQGQALENADPATFQMLSIDQILDTDKKQVYYRGEVLSQDAANFERIDKRYYKDSHKVWIKIKDPKFVSLYQFVLLSSEQASSFEVIEPGNLLSRTQTQVFYLDHEVKGANPTQINMLGGNYWQDQYAVFFRDTKIQEANPSTFSVLKYPYAKDESHIYYKGEIIEDALAQSFENIPDRSGKASQYFQDKRNVYLKGEALENADPMSFEFVYFPNGVASIYSKDKNRVFYNGQLLPDALASEFRLSERNGIHLGDDGQSLFKNGQMLK